MLISSSISIAQITYECKGNDRCFDPDLSLEVGDVLHWDVIGQNITEQVDAFEWRDQRLTHIKLEISEDIRGLSVSVARNFATYFKLIYTIDGIDNDYSQLISGVSMSNIGILFELLSYTNILDYNGELTNVFVQEVQDDRNYNRTFSYDRFNQTVHDYSYGDVIIEDGIYKKTWYSYQNITPENDSDKILSSSEIFEEKRIEVETGVLILNNKTNILFDQTSGSRTSQILFILEQDSNQGVEFSLGDFDRGKIIIFIGLTVGILTIIFILVRKYG
ncbi:MAG: hypothetical protein GPJ54_16220 [Candidatus Heimdallarchaeota archaeon]|nr:hypothetical protein [Candidatus Heimdallarchaeota archaeon]